MSKFFKSALNKLKKKKVEPRSLEDISKEYQELCFKSGQAQYQAEVYTKEVVTLNKRIQEVNYEAAERNKLDAIAKSLAKPEAEQVKDESKAKAVEAKNE